MEQTDYYEHCLENMYGLRRFGIKLGLETIRTILSALGNPQNRFACVHIAGTNGKGSIASALSSILIASGYKVGLYTSPHLVTFNERIRVNGQMVSNEDVLRAYEAVKKTGWGHREPTFFEYTTAMAFYEFGRRKVDWAVIETGMGGRLDATNVIKPALSIISNLSLEHQAYLGRTLTEIAKEKGGIIKFNTPVVTGVHQKNATAMLEKIAIDNSARLFRLGKDFRVRRNKSGGFNYFGMNQNWHHMRSTLAGDHQINNTALVLAACELLSENTPNLTLPHIRKGLAETRWPGRLEVASTSPYILIDGAHNLEAVRSLAAYLSQNFSNRNIILVTGILDDKPYAAMLRILLPLCNRVILTRPKIQRALDPEKLCEIAKGILSDISIVSDVDKAVTHAIKIASNKDVICIAGSLYVVGEAKAALSALDF